MTKLVKYYKKLMKDVSKEEPRYEYIIEAYEQKIRELQTTKGRKTYGRKTYGRKISNF